MDTDRDWQAHSAIIRERLYSDILLGRHRAFAAENHVDLIHLVHTVCGGNFAAAVRQADKLNAAFLAASKG